jgi:serine/threonine protein kinase
MASCTETSNVCFLLLSCVLFLFFSWQKELSLLIQIIALCELNSIFFAGIFLFDTYSHILLHTASNLLISSSGILKLADFGLTTSFVTPPYLSNNVVSLYYRPPELLMGSHCYGPEIDIWSAGCILVELLTNNYLFAGANERYVDHGRA